HVRLPWWPAGARRSGWRGAHGLRRSLHLRNPVTDLPAPGLMRIARFLATTVALIGLAYAATPNVAGEAAAPDRWSSGGAAEDLGTNVNFGEQFPGSGFGPASGAARRCQ